jgi:hypothetical protein
MPPQSNRFFEKRLDIYTTRLNQLLTKADVDQSYEHMNSATVSLDPLVSGACGEVVHALRIYGLVIPFLTLTTGIEIWPHHAQFWAGDHT